MREPGRNERQDQGGRSQKKGDPLKQGKQRLKKERFEKKTKGVKKWVKNQVIHFNTKGKRADS